MEGKGTRNEREVDSGMNGEMNWRRGNEKTSPGKKYESEKNPQR